MSLILQEKVSFSKYLQLLLYIETIINYSPDFSGYCLLDLAGPIKAFAKTLGQASRPWNFAITLPNILVENMDFVSTSAALQIILDLAFPKKN